MKKNLKNILMIFTLIFVAIIGIKQNTVKAAEFPNNFTLNTDTGNAIHPNNPNNPNNDGSELYGQKYKYYGNNVNNTLFCTLYSAHAGTSYNKLTKDNDPDYRAIQAGIGYIIKNADYNYQQDSNLQKYLDVTLAINQFLYNRTENELNKVYKYENGDKVASYRPIGFIQDEKIRSLIDKASEDYYKVKNGIKIELKVGEDNGNGLNYVEPNQTNTQYQAETSETSFTKYYKVTFSNNTTSRITVSTSREITSTDLKIKVYTGTLTGNSIEYPNEPVKTIDYTTPGHKVQLDTNDLGGADGTKYIKVEITGYNGEYLKLNIVPGASLKYDIAELYTVKDNPDAQTLTPNITKETVDYENDSVSLSVSRQPLPQLPKIKIIKTDLDGNPLEDAWFTLKYTVEAGEDTDNSYTNKELITDSQGEFTKNYTSTGTYCISENKAPNGYFLDNSEHCFTLSIDNNNQIQFTKISDSSTLLNDNNNITEYNTSDNTIYLRFKNEKNKIYIQKTNSKGTEIIPGSWLRITTSQIGDGGNIPAAYNHNGQDLKWAGTDTNGRISIEGLPEGTYFLYETKAPAGYMLRKDPKTIKITRYMTKQDYIYSLPNYKIVLNITKVDSINKNKPLKGAKFQLLNENNEIVEINGINEWSTDNNGKIKIELIPAGTYTLRETQAPAGYVLLSPEIRFTVDAYGIITYDNDKTLEANTFTITNAKNKIIISKREITGKEELPGAKLQITDAIGKVVKDIDGNELSWTSTNEAHVINGLKKGKYYLVETQAKDGYVRATESIVFTVDAYGVVKVNNQTMEDSIIIMTNAQTKVSISKQDVTTKQELPGAQLQITDENGNVIILNGEELKWVSTEEAHVIEGLGQGTYYIVETTAPDGYTLNEEKVKFTIDEDGVISGDTVMYNTPIVDVPSTLSVQSILITLAGIVFVGLGVGLYFYGVKKQKEI